MSCVIKGEKGDKGDMGTSIYGDNGVPDNNFGNDGDQYLDFDTNNLYEKVAGVWILIDNIQGGKGDVGDSTILGNAPPNNAVGQDGDTFLDLATGNLYKKMAGVWSLVGNVKGIKGDKGDKGDKGEKGITGDKGEKGDNGDVGDLGDKGDKGDKGDTGIQGIDGDKGIQGDKGTQGAQGIKGEKGDTGDKGDKGDTGDKGIVGDIGDVGDAGIKGEKGDLGDKGDKGEKGEDIIPNPQVVADEFFIEVGGQGTFALLTNDSVPNGIVSLVLSAEPSIYDDGTITFSGSPLLGIINFTPVPRLLNDVSVGYTITDGLGNTNSAIVKIKPDKTFSDTPIVTSARGSDIYVLNPVSGVENLLFNSTSAGINGIAGNRGDVLLYYNSTVDIIAYDRFEPSEAVIFTHVNPINSLGFDNQRYFLYMADNTVGATDVIIKKFVMQPYERYTTGMQPISSYNVTVPLTPTTNVVVNSLAVHDPTGYVYFVGIDNSGAGVGRIYSFEPSVDPTQVFIGPVLPNPNSVISFANNGVLYLVDNTTNISYTVSLVNTTFVLNPVGISPIVDAMGEPLYNV